MIPLLVQFIVAIIVAGFLLWALQLLLPHVPLPAEFHAILSVVLKIVIAGVIIFYFVVPLIKMIPNHIQL